MFFNLIIENTGLENKIEFKDLFQVKVLKDITNLNNSEKMRETISISNYLFNQIKEDNFVISPSIRQYRKEYPERRERRTKNHCFTKPSPLGNLKTKFEIF